MKILKKRKGKKKKRESWGTNLKISKTSPVNTKLQWSLQWGRKNWPGEKKRWDSGKRGFWGKQEKKPKPKKILFSTAAHQRFFFSAHKLSAPRSSPIAGHQHSQWPQAFTKKKATALHWFSPETPQKREPHLLPHFLDKRQPPPSPLWGHQNLNPLTLSRQPPLASPGKRKKPKTSCLSSAKETLSPSQPDGLSSRLSLGKERLSKTKHTDLPPNPFTRSSSSQLGPHFLLAFGPQQFLFPLSCRSKKRTERRPSSLLTLPQQRRPSQSQLFTANRQLARTAAEPSVAARHSGAHRFPICSPPASSLCSRLQPSKRP